MRQVHHVPAAHARAAIARKVTVMKKETLGKIFEYASMPVHGTLSRKLRKDIACQINEGKVYTKATLFLGDEFVRIIEHEESTMINTYYDWDGIISVRTIGKVTEE